ncbi:MAG TPA: [FeFe] hydrogenase H-cluster maturation GTPase HydF [Lachnospiraceae bacterium]
MKENLNMTPRANRLHIGIFGKRNAGKSSLFNAITKQKLAIVSDVAGTTADPVYKAMEISALGPCVFIDTAGFDDVGSLGEERIKQTLRVVEKTDLAILLCQLGDLSEEKEWIQVFLKNKIPYLLVLNKIDREEVAQAKSDIERILKEKVFSLSAKSGEGIEDFIELLRKKAPGDYEAKTILGDLVEENDLVLLVMPQDIQAPKGRLILPQVQVMRELLDRKCIFISSTKDGLTSALAGLKEAPKLIITDSQIFDFVYEHKPKESLLTSFSVLFAGYKGDVKTYVEGVKEIEKLCSTSKILIAEACTHAPLTEDIGRVKIPRLLRQRVGEELTVDVVSGLEFPKDIEKYQLIIQCGACMCNRAQVLHRIALAKEKNIPITNYGIVIAYLKGILDKIEV